MSRVEWVVYERTAQWASALRLALATSDSPVRLRELRNMAELDAELAFRPHAFVAVEVHRGNFAQLLAWLAKARELHAHATFAILLDRTLSRDIDHFVAVLLETGAQAIATSPRRLEPLIALGLRHERIAGFHVENASFTDQLWASLPWQAT